MSELTELHKTKIGVIKQKSIWFNNPERSKLLYRDNIVGHTIQIEIKI